MVMITDKGEHTGINAGQCVTPTHGEALSFSPAEGSPVLCKLVDAVILEYQ